MIERILNLYQKFRYKFYQITTLVKLKLFSKNSGNKNCFIKPILLSYNSLSLGSGIFIRDHGRVEAVKNYRGVKFNPEIIIGNLVSIEQNVHITCALKVEIGENTAIASNVTITDINHKYTDILTPPDKQPIEVKPVKIGRNCKIYNNTVILPGVTLGNHNIIAANSVVGLGKYDDYCVLAGSPAKIIKRYDFETKSWLRTNDKGEFLK